MSHLFEPKRIVVLGFVLILVLALGPVHAAAGPVGAGVGAQTMTGSAVIAEGETVSGLDVMAGTVVVRGTVDGDLNGVAGDVVIAETGVVAGDVSVATGSLRVAGTVEGSVSAGAGVVSVTPTGNVGGDFSVGADTVTVDGSVGGDAKIGAETITLGQTSSIGGELRYDGALTQESGSSVQGPVIEDTSIGGFGPIGVSGHAWPTLGWLDTVYGLLANLLLGALLLLAFPEFSTSVARRATDRTGRSALIGFLLLITVPLLMLLLAITIVGIPLAILGLFLFAFTAWIGVVYGEYTTGRWLIARVQDEPSRWYGLFLGLVLFAILGAIPFVGGLFVFGAFLVGFGALGSTLRGAYNRWRGRKASPTTATEESTTSTA